MKLRSFYLKLLVLCLMSKVLFAQSDHKLWYKQPATFFEESLVLGNGQQGATVHGGVDTDKIYLNDATLWAGEPVNPNINPDAYKNLPEIREALKKGNYPLAEQLNKKLQGKFSESYAPLGTLFLNFNHVGNPSNYYRELDINNAIAKLHYEVNGVTYTREYLVSYPDKVLLIKLTASKKGALNLNLGFSSLLKYTLSKESKSLKVRGYAPYHAEPSYRGDMPDAVRFDEKKGIHFTTLFSIKNTDGQVTQTDTSLILSNASEAYLYVSMATSFNGFDKNPVSEGLNDQVLASQLLTKALTKSYDVIKKAHITDYQHLFNRISLNLGKSTADELPTDERLKRYATGKEDKYLEILYFQFGRYLLISSSRTPNVPANLQGIWNHYIRPPWSSNYTTNINLEENYWLVENANLSELHQPLLGFIGNLAKSGNKTARNFYGVDGWTVAHNSDIWAMTYSVGEGSGDPSWANWNMGGAWLSTHLWEHYQFSKDENFLRNYAFNLMKGAALFGLQWLVEDGKGNLITSPSTSPENRYITPEGFKGATMFGGAADLAMIRECFLQTIEASKILNQDKPFADSLTKALARLYPYQIGKKGNLQEWYYDWEDEDPQHRHQSHLFGLFPGHHIRPDKTPALAAACRKTLEIKGDYTTGWSKGWRINLWARLWDGPRAYKMYRELLNYVDPDNYQGTDKKKGGGTYPNLLDAHAPFQIDGNFGGTAAVIEMLVQSDENEIRLLPAISDAWAEGSVKGICARGGFELAMNWKDKAPTKITISSKKGGKTALVFGNTRKEIQLTKGQRLVVTW